MTAAPQPAAARQAGTVAWTGTTYFAEGLPWSVLHQIASEFLTAAGLPPSQVGYTSALHLTSTLKFLWSPVVDLYGSFRQWIFATQAVLGALIGLLAVLAHNLSQSTGQDTSLIWMTLIAIGVASATHDIACDGYYMDALPRAEQARYAGVRVAAFRIASERAHVVLATGGLGPTADDLTREVLAHLAGVDLELDPASLAHLQ